MAAKVKKVKNLISNAKDAAKQRISDDPKIIEMRVQSISATEPEDDDVQPTSIWEEEFEFDEDDIKTINEISEKDINEMIQTQKKYEKFGTVCSCCGDSKIMQFADKNKTIFVCALLIIHGLIGSYFLYFHFGYEEYGLRLWFYTIYFAILLVCLVLSQLLVTGVMKILGFFTDNSWAVFYVKGLQPRLHMFVLSALMQIALQLWGAGVHYDTNAGVSSVITCISLSSAVFLVSHLGIRYIALTSYFVTFKQQTRKLKTFIFFIEIMSNKGVTSKDGVLFNIPIMNFLVDFPNYNQTQRAKKRERTVHFQLLRENKKMMKRIADAVRVKEFDIEKHEQEKRNSHLFSNDKSVDFDEDLDVDALKTKNPTVRGDNFYDADQDNTDIDEIGEIYNLSYDLYKINITENTHELIADMDLNKLTRILSYLIFLRLNEKKKKIMRNQKSHSKNPSVGFASLGHMLGKSGDAPDLLEWEKKYAKNKKITKEIFIQIFKQYGPNKELLEKLGGFAWKKFAADGGSYLDINKMNQHIFKIIKDLLLLKQSIDSYAGIIGNLERIINNVTPILLLLPYLFLFGFAARETITLYISVIAIIGFFGSSYLPSIFNSISFIVVLNPFLVGDWISFDDQIFQVHQISLMASVFRETQNGYFYMYQNEQLGDSKKPIMNLSRSIYTKYRWDVHVKGALSHGGLQLLVEAIKESISQNRELRHADYKNLKAEARSIFGSKKKVNFTMPFQVYSPTVRSLVLDTITSVMYREKCNWCPSKNVGFKATPVTVEYKIDEHRSP